MNDKYKDAFTFDLSDKFFLEDIENRRLFLDDIVETEVIHDIVYHILRYNSMDKDIPVEERKPIILFINSPGGSVTDGFSLIDVIETSKTPVYTVNLGICYSMGFLIFIAGKKRFAMPSSTYLCHDGSSFAYDSMSKLKDRMEFELGEMEQYTKNYIIDHTNITSDLYDKNYRIEWYFYPEEAKNLGVVTHIIGKDCSIDDVT